MGEVLLNLPPIVISLLSSLLFTLLCLATHQRKIIFETIMLVGYILTSSIWSIHGYTVISIVMLTPLLTYLDYKISTKHKKSANSQYKFTMAEIGFTVAPLLCFLAITAGWGYLTCLMSAGILLISSENISNFIQQK
ncbi:hypothetical protein [Thermococcus sp.]|uniref:hypothetical protein n=1 Tax=Thermococcus sp. TaxID=35749 RepID=UPI002604EE83|nr:hypothetical protein [Thermococcus sp.]